VRAGTSAYVGMESVTKFFVGPEAAGDPRRLWNDTVENGAGASGPWTRCSCGCISSAVPSTASLDEQGNVNCLAFVQSFRVFFVFFLLFARSAVPPAAVPGPSGRLHSSRLIDERLLARLVEELVFSRVRSALQSRRGERGQQFVDLRLRSAGKKGCMVGSLMWRFWESLGGRDVFVTPTHPACWRERGRTARGRQVEAPCWKPATAQGLILRA